MAFKNLLTLLEEFQGLYLKALATQVREKDIVASGALGDSLNPRVQPKVKAFGNLYEMKVEMIDYADEVDQGTQPAGKLPNRFKAATGQSKIEKWLTYKNVIDRLGIQGMPKTEQQSLAYYISRNLETKGKEGRNFLAPAINPIHKKIKGRVAEAVSEDVVFSLEEIKRIIEENK